ncbi:MAG: hypothetical protein MZV70_59230 [Desulfobacterales bacterium]|nr:hypothetical protein [Desulfobacterales bacterium]
MRPMRPNGHGVIGIRLAEKDEVVAADVIAEQTTLLTVTEKGLGKRTKIEEYPVHGRGGRGSSRSRSSRRGGPAVGVLQVRHEDEIVIITEQRQAHPDGGRQDHGAGTQHLGVKLMDLDQDDKIVSIGSGYGGLSLSKRSLRPGTSSSSSSDTFFLFAVAYYAEKKEKTGKSLVNNAYIYSLSLAVYCTS